MITTPCADCGNPCWYYSGSFYRCRQCGYESIHGSEQYGRGEAAYVSFCASENAAAAQGTGTRVSAARAPEQLGLSLFSTSDK